jgi:hypothetical protein
MINKRLNISLILIGIIIISTHQLCNGTIIVSIGTKDGIVIAADSRVTYQNNSYVDTAEKIIVVDSCAVALYGLVGVSDEDLRNYVKALELNDKASIQSIKGVGELETIHWKVEELVSKKYYVWFQSGKTSNVCGGYIIFGFQDNNPQLISCFNGDFSDARHSSIEIKPCYYGLIYKGQTDVISRLIYGVDENLGLVDEDLSHDRETADCKYDVNKDHKREEMRNKLQYKIAYYSMTIDDAVQFAKNLVQITITMQKYSSGNELMSRPVAGVGGDIDILTITKDGTRWIQKKKNYE